MTGEITLRGTVLPVGGIKEKVLAAHRSGIKRVVLPDRNRKDIVDIPETVRAELELVFVKKIDEVLDLTLETVPVVVPGPEGAAAGPVAGRGGPGEAPPGRRLRAAPGWTTPEGGGHRDHEHAGEREAEPQRHDHQGSPYRAATAAPRVAVSSRHVR